MLISKSCMSVSTNRNNSAPQIMVRRLIRPLEKNTSVTPTQHSTTGSSRHSVPPRPRVSIVAPLSSPPPDGMNWLMSASRPTHRMTMPATPRGSTPLCCFLRPAEPRLPLTFRLLFAPLGAAFLAILHPPGFSSAISFQDIAVSTTKQSA